VYIHNSEFLNEKIKRYIKELTKKLRISDLAFISLVVVICTLSVSGPSNPNMCWVPSVFYRRLAGGNARAQNMVKIIGLSNAGYYKGAQRKL
jgi:hypothetical protein